jgi:1-acyl-sn-glycerol-3-phosphate acyltransferase
MPNAAPLEFIPPRLDQRVLFGARLLLPLWLRSGGIRGIQVEGIERLQLAMERFQSGQSRLLLAFRHPSLDDPAVMAQLLWGELARSCRPRPHAQFLFDRGIPLWAGAWMGWLLSRLGGCSIQRSKLDLPALRTARALLMDGAHPFAVAPEGATNGHNEAISPLEPGVAQLALWTADELDRAGRPEATEVLPIGLQYRFTKLVWPAIEALLSQLEADGGLPASSDHSLDPERLYGRLFRLAELILSRMEGFYRDAYHLPLEKNASRLPKTTTESLPEPLPDANDQLGERLNLLMEAVLTLVEHSLGVKTHGGVGERCLRLEQAGWDRLYPTPGNHSEVSNKSAVDNRAGVSSPAGASALDRGLADRWAEETERQLWHMRLVESFVAVSGRYVKDQPSQERFADTLLILWDTMARIKGNNPARRPRLGPRRALVRIGEPLAIAPRLAAYRLDRRAGVAALTAELRSSLLGMIVPTGPAN